jgi:hypothetical protein
LSLPPLLITAAFDVGETPHVKLRDTHQRVLHHMEGLLAWLKSSEFCQIIFAKNCETKIQARVLSETAAAFGKELEFLQLPSSKFTARQGKGFGEGEIVGGALERSGILEKAPCFAKSTGKLFLENHELLRADKWRARFFRCEAPNRRNPSAWHRLVNKLHQSEAGSRCLADMHRLLRVPWFFIGARPQFWVDTRFYVCRRDFYLANLSRSHRRVQDRLGYSLEAAFYDDLQRVEGVGWIDEMPLVYGASGTLGTTAALFAEPLRRRAAALAAELLCS